MYRCRLCTLHGWVRCENDRHCKETDGRAFELNIRIIQEAANRGVIWWIVRNNEIHGITITGFDYSHDVEAGRAKETVYIRGRVDARHTETVNVEDLGRVLFYTKEDAQEYMQRSGGGGNV